MDRYSYYQTVGLGDYVVTVIEPYAEINYLFETEEEADEFWNNGEWRGTAIKEY